MKRHDAARTVGSSGSQLRFHRSEMPAGASLARQKSCETLPSVTRVKRHIQELQVQLAHVQRLNELGQVVSTLVHEVNQPITAIRNYVSACRRLAVAGNQAGVQSALERMEGQAKRTSEIIERIRDFVKKRDARMQTEDLSLD